MKTNEENNLIKNVDMEKAILNLREEMFTKEHKYLYDAMKEAIWQYSEPQYFGEDVHPAIKFDRFDLLPINQTVNQTHRVAGRVSRASDAEKVFRSLGKGFKFTRLPPAVFEYHGNVQDPERLTGDTRLEYFSSVGQTHYIAAIYTQQPWANEDDIEDAISYMGQSLNVHDVSNNNTMADIQNSLKKSCKVWINSKGKSGVDPLDLDAIHERLKKIGGNFTEHKRSQIAYGVFNEYNPHQVVASWSSDKKAKYRLEDYMKTFKLVNTDKIIYLVSAASTVSKILTKAFAVADQYKDKEVRVMLHTSTLTGSDLESSYHRVASSNIKLFESYMNSINNVSGGYVTRIRIYGLFPAVGSIHSFDEPVLYNSKSKVLYQRKHGYRYDIDVDNDFIDMENDDE